MATTSEERVHTVTSFDAGMQRKTTRFLAQPNEVFFAKNADFNFILGGITKALGYEKKGNTINSGAPILGCGILVTQSGTRKIFVFSGTDMYVYNASGGNWVAQAIAGLSTDRQYEAVSHLDVVFVATGRDTKTLDYTGVSATLHDFTGSPQGRFPFVHKNRLYLFNTGITMNQHVAYKSRFFYTDLPRDNAGQLTSPWGFNAHIDLATTANSPIVTSALGSFLANGIKVGDPFFIFEGADAGEYEVKSVDTGSQITLTEDLSANASNLDYWVGGNWQDVNASDGDEGTGISENNDRLLLFKRFSLWKFNKGATVEDDSLIRVRNVPGTTSHRSITNILDWTFYWSDSGLWRYDGSSSILISNPIQEIIDGIDAANLDNVVGWSADERILKMYVGNINNSATGLVISNCVVCYDALSNAYWVEEYDDQINCAVQWVETNALENFIFSNDGEAFKSETSNMYNGEAFPMEIETWFYFPIAPETQLNYTRFKTYTRHGREITCSVKFAYYSDRDGFRVDEDWRPLKPKYKTSDEQEWHMNLDSVKASGYALKFIEASDTGPRPTIERIAAFYTGGELR